MRLREVELGARRAHLVVERVDLDVELLADVAVLLLEHLAELGVVDVGVLEAGRREDVRRGEHRPLAQHADPGLGEHRLVDLPLRRLVLTPERLGRPAPLGDVRVEHRARGREEASPLLHREAPQEAAVTNDRLERLDRRSQRIRGAVVVAVRHALEGSEARAAPTRATGWLIGNWSPRGW